MSHVPASARPARSASGERAHGPWPGLAACFAAAVVGVLVSRMFPIAGALLVAILLGVVVGNVRPVPASWAPGVAVSAKKLLRAGIVVLGLKISFGEILGLGWPVIALVVAIVAIGMVGTYRVGTLMGVPRDGAMLVASGFSICGAAAVAAVDGLIRPHREHVATSIALVVLYGSLMIALVPAAVTALDLPPETAALWAGGGTHEVAQVVAIGGVLGGGTVLSTAVVVKLARVVMLAPTMIGIALWNRRRGEETGERPPLVPGFVVGFLAAVLVRTFVSLPPWFLTAADLAQTTLLAMAMFALGLGVTRQALQRASSRALVLGAVSTLIVNAVALGGALLLTT